MEDEVEILKSIFVNDITSINLTSPNPTLEIMLYPANSEENFNKKFIRLNLVVNYPKNYPDEVPKFELKNIRGISDDDVAKIKKAINDKALESVGMPMLFEIFDVVKDLLTNHGDIPSSCVCAICLFNFDKEQKQNFMRLECYHYFHTQCLIKHIDYMQREISKEKEEAERNMMAWKARHVSCPVCREPLKNEEVNDLDLHRNDKQIKETTTTTGDYSISTKTRELQRKMQILFEKQKIKGGIIDIDEKKQDIIILTRPTQNSSNTDNATIQSS